MLFTVGKCISKILQVIVIQEHLKITNEDKYMKKLIEIFHNYSGIEMIVS